MAEQTEKIKRRKLRASTQTMRERAEAETGKKPGMRSTLRVAKHRIARLPVWKPFRFIGRMISRFIIPPYIRNSWRELRQVTWPNGRETRQLTTAVILFSIIFGAIVAAFDYGLDKLFKEVIIK